MLKYLAAFGLATLGGDASKDRVVAIVKSTGAAFDQAEFDSVWPQLEGKNFNSLVSEGAAKLSASASSGAAAAPAAAAGGAAPAAGKKEEKKVEEEEDDDMGFGLFD